ncbi:SRPBCC family protein [Gloeocapsa sp. PCC 73106]|uniref:SRPBCC family protein n=1 Tax=Gloeocapsa sp. PCC 73106 TaxID=102232 RepID=UPI0002AC6C2D|nr:SRPBCC family protein [Gloeocapsa sp. PCC 73106]ELR98499.1 oligoketide cyclase/lipid transport protein [Gloeocapsa sp. PCC 73106]
MPYSAVTCAFKFLLAAIVLNSVYLATPLAATQNLEKVLLQLSGEERSSLQSDQVSLSGDRGEYQGRFLVEASLAQAWDVLTDYDNFTDFLPNVTAAQLLETDGNHKIFEQVQVVSVFFVTREARVKIATEETEFTNIRFSLVEGDLERLEGTWELTPISRNQESTPTQVLITYRVKVQPNNDTPTNIFYNVYRDSLQDSLEAIKTEIELRANYK